MSNMPREDWGFALFNLILFIKFLILLFGFLGVYRMLTTFEFQMLQRVYRGLRFEPHVKRKVMSCIKKSESRRSAGQSNPAHTIPRGCNLLIEAFDELERHPEIYGDPKLYDLATVYLLFRAHRIRFMEVAVDKRVAWLKEHCTSFKR